MTDISKPMRVEEAADYLGIKTSYLYQLVFGKKITCYKPSGKLLFFYKEDLNAFIRRGKITGEFEVEDKAEKLINAG